MLTEEEMSTRAVCFISVIHNSDLQIMERQVTRRYVGRKEGSPPYGYTEDFIHPVMSLF